MSLEERYRVVCELFEEACALPEGEREAFVRARAPGDDKMAAEVLELLEFDADSSGPFADHDTHSGSATRSSQMLERLSAHSPRKPRYRLEGEIGRGGMGAILEVWDEDLRRKLAMKLLLKQATADGDETPDVGDRAISRFIEEAQITGQLDHPGIVPVHELGVDDKGRVYFTMRLVRGRDLRKVLRLVKTGAEGWTPNRALGVLMKACEAVAFAHSRGVVHRDLKPGNVMVGAFGEVYVMDWGLGRVLDDEAPSAAPDRPERNGSGSGAVAPERVRTLRADTDTPGSPAVTLEGDIAGTPYYMSPEQAHGRIAEIGPQSDVYSIGAMLYELLSGQKPYSDRSEHPAVFQALVALREGPPTPLAEVAPDVPPELVAICEQAMARDVEARFADVGELAENLRAYLEHRVVPAFKTGPLIELRKWVERNRGMAVVIAGLLLAMCAIGFLVAWAQRAARVRADRNLEEYTAARLTSEAQALWPIGPEGIEATETWLQAARPLAGRLDARRAELAAFELRHADAQRVQRDGAARSEPDGFALENLENRAANFREKVSALEHEPGRTAEGLHSLEVYRLELALLETEIERLERERPRQRDWHFADANLERRRTALGRLVAELEDLSRPGSGWIARIEGRLERALHTASDTYAPDWERAIASIENDCPAYGGLRIVRQPGLVPLGRNPETGLWEFWHTASGERPSSGAPGRWSVRPETGLVLVLLPGGAFRLGFQTEDPEGAEYCDLELYDFIDELSIHEQSLLQVAPGPYLISRYELTQGQWRRATGDFGQSTFFAGAKLAGQPLISRTHPVESVSWTEADRALRAWGLRLPTEAQWTFAARGGGSALFGWEWDFGKLRGAVNSSDESTADSYLLHAPVDSFEPNPYGLHHALGNVSEWCLDWFAEPDCYPDVLVRQNTGELVPSTASKKTVRGGSFNHPPDNLRISRRLPYSPAVRQRTLGLRPACALRSKAP